MDNNNLINTSQLWEKEKHEPSKAYKKFLKFLECKTLNEVAKEERASISTIKKISAKYNWSQRKEAWLDQLNQQNLELQRQKQIQELKNYRSTVIEVSKKTQSVSILLMDKIRIYAERLNEESFKDLTLPEICTSLKHLNTILQSSLNIESKAIGVNILFEAIDLTKFDSDILD